MGQYFDATFSYSVEWRFCYKNTRGDYEAALSNLCRKHSIVHQYQSEWSTVTATWHQIMIEADTENHFNQLIITLNYLQENPCSYSFRLSVKAQSELLWSRQLHLQRICVKLTKLMHLAATWDIVVFTYRMQTSF